jgi:hypothetical protein
MIVITQSNNFSSLFPNNKAADFRMQLLQNENLSRNAQIALLEIIVPVLEETTLCYIYCNIAGFSQFGEKWRRVLRVIDLQANQTEKFTFPKPIYIDIFSDNIEEIQFTLKDGNDKLIDFKPGSKTVIIFEIINGAV